MKAPGPIVRIALGLVVVIIVASIVAAGVSAVFGDGLGVVASFLAGFLGSAFVIERHLPMP